MAVKRITDFPVIGTSPDVTNSYFGVDNVTAGTRKMKLDDVFSIYNRAKLESLYPSLLNPALYATLQQLEDGLENEANLRDAADVVLQGNINTEATTRANADIALQNQINDNKTGNVSLGGITNRAYNTYPLNATIGSSKTVMVKFSILPCSEIDIDNATITIIDTSFKIVRNPDKTLTVSINGDNKITSTKIVNNFEPTWVTVYFKPSGRLYLYINEEPQGSVPVTFIANGSPTIGDPNGARVHYDTMIFGEKDLYNLINGFYSTDNFEYYRYFMHRLVSKALIDKDYNIDGNLIAYYPDRTTANFWIPVDYQLNPYLIERSSYFIVCNQAIVNPRVISKFVQVKRNSVLVPALFGPNAKAIFTSMAGDPGVVPTANSNSYYSIGTFILNLDVGLGTVILADGLKEVTQPMLDGPNGDVIQYLTSSLASDISSGDQIGELEIFYK